MKQKRLKLTEQSNNISIYQKKYPLYEISIYDPAIKEQKIRHLHCPQFLNVPG